MKFLKLLTLYLLLISAESCQENLQELPANSQSNIHFTSMSGLENSQFHFVTDQKELIIAGSANYGLFISKIDSTGKSIWYLELIEIGDAIFNAGVSLSQEEFIVIGRLQTLDNPSLIGTAIVVKFNTSGNIIWTKKSSNTDYYFDVVAGKNGCFFIQSGTHLISFDATGIEKWRVAFKSINESIFKTICTNSNGEPVVLLRDYPISGIVKILMIFLKDDGSIKKRIDYQPDSVANLTSSHIIANQSGFHWFNNYGNSSSGYTYMISTDQAGEIRHKTKLPLVETVYFNEKNEFITIEDNVNNGPNGISNLFRITKYDNNYLQNWSIDCLPSDLQHFGKQTYFRHGKWLVVARSLNTKTSVSSLFTFIINNNGELQYSN